MLFKIINLLMACICLGYLYGGHICAYADTKEVLLVVSNSETDENICEFYNTFKRELAKEDDNVKFTVVELNMRHAPDNSRRNCDDVHIINYICKNNPELIIFSQSPAVNLFYPKHTEVLKNFNVLVSGYPHFSNFNAKKFKNAVALKRPIDIPANVELGFKLFPDTKQIAVITDCTDEGLAIEEFAKQALKDIKGVSVKYINGAS